MITAPTHKDTARRGVVAVIAAKPRATQETGHVALTTADRVLTCAVQTVLVPLLARAESANALEGVEGGEQG